MESTQNTADDDDFGDLPPVTPEQRIAELEAALLQVRDDQLRERAELDNQRKRLVRDVEQARKFANERLLESMLPVLDNLERGLEASGTDFERLREGVDLTLKQFRKVVEDHGLVAVDGAGTAFNPDHHQAVSTTPANAENPADTVVAAMQKGYLLNGRLLRPALVVVAK
ncbi:MAG: nucleotide exchange factor GrpE [Xanthomonadales bacterium]|nr:nucleotide exchange factor GrpE [Xanthomonadales bacterium]